MRPAPLLAAAILACAIRPAAAAPPACTGFFNQTEQGYKLEAGRLEPSGPKVAAGTELEFVGITKIRDKFYLTRARDVVVFDAENVELTEKCDLPTRPPPMAR